jgi:GDP/UDP-N,N'-diacetylbacillosamine 2-epimerase (hydrolysing)
MPDRSALVLLHPQTPDVLEERRCAELLLRCVESIGFDRIVIVYPNNDPGSDGIAACWDALREHGRLVLRRDLPRPLFLGLLRESALLAGNSSSGIIEAASFGTPVVDIGHRQSGRERGRNVFHADAEEEAIVRQLRRVWNGGNPIRFAGKNLYDGGRGGAGRKIAAALARIELARFKRKIIAY